MYKAHGDHFTKQNQYIKSKNLGFEKVETIRDSGTIQEILEMDMYCGIYNLPHEQKCFLQNHKTVYNTESDWVITKRCKLSLLMKEIDISSIKCS